MRLLPALLALLPVLAACADQPQGPSTAPGRVLALAPNLAELWAFTCGPEALVGRVSFTDHPPALEALPLVGAALGPDLERVAALHPDLILLTQGAAGGPVATALAGAGRRLEFFRVESPEDVLAGARRLEALCGAAPGPSRQLEEALATLGRKAASQGPGLRVLMLHGHRPLVAAGPGSWGDALLTLAGARSALPPSAQAYPVLSLEDLVALAPDCILDSSGVYEEAMDGYSMQFPKGLPRVPLEHPALLRPGPRFPQAVEAVRAALLACDATGVGSPPP